MSTPDAVVEIPEDLLDVLSGDDHDQYASSGTRHTGRFAFDEKLVDWFVRIANRPRTLVAATVGVLVSSGLAYAALEDHGPIEGLWWAVVTGFTVGYGDMYPATTAGRGVGVVLMVSMFVLALCLGAQITSRLIEDRDEWTHREQELVKEQLRDIRAQLAALGRTDSATVPVWLCHTCREPIAADDLADVVDFSHEACVVNRGEH